MNNECGKIIYMGNVQGPDEMNDTCVKTMHAGTMGRGFTVPALPGRRRTD
jgi:hypothetical protein